MNGKRTICGCVVERMLYLLVTMFVATGKLLQGVMCRLSIDNVTQPIVKKCACSGHSFQHACLLCIYIIYIAVGIV